ncbi:sodium-coupled monocarboxylate transporter 2 [Ixodes scapularis]
MSPGSTTPTAMGSDEHPANSAATLTKLLLKVDRLEATVTSLKLKNAAMRLELKNNNSLVMKRLDFVNTNLAKALDALLTIQPTGPGYASVAGNATRQTGDETPPLRPNAVNKAPANNETQRPSRQSTSASTAPSTHSDNVNPSSGKRNQPEDGWNEVRRRRKAEIRGGASKSTTLRTVPRGPAWKALFVTRMNPDTTTEDIEQFVADVVKDDTLVCTRLKSRMNLDFTSDENFWSCFLGLYVHNLFRAGMDQTVVQRYLASRTLRDAQRIMVIGIALNVFYMIVIGLMALALIYWYRDCDPMLTGAIKKFDQILPYYVKQNLMDLPGFSGLFLTGVVSAATSTISSIINSQAAVCYVDVVSQYKKLSDSHVTLLTKGLAFLFGIMMTVYAVVVPYLGSAVRIIMVVHNGASGPFVGMFLLALAFPWTNGKGVVIATILTTAVQFWQMFGKLAYNVHAPRMKVTLDYCPNNFTYASKQIQNSTLFDGSIPRRDIFPLYQMSSNWSVLATTAFTVLLGMLISLLTGGAKTWKHNIHLTSHTFLRLWSKLDLLPCDIEKQTMEEPLDEGPMRRNIVLDQPLLEKDAAA